jgi:hypothetical protein
MASSLVKICLLVPNVGKLKTRDETLTVFPVKSCEYGDMHVTLQLSSTDDTG